MSNWPSTWVMSALKAADVPQTDFTRKALALWNKSTPTEVWTHNPIGIPSAGYSRRKVPNTPYALFLNWGDFNAAFKKVLDKERSGNIRIHLTDGKFPYKLWREINSLQWPVVTAEENWPHAMREWVDDQYSSMLGVKASKPRKSTGTTGAQTAHHEAVIATTRAMHAAVQAKLDTRKAIEFILKGQK